LMTVMAEVIVEFYGARDCSVARMQCGTAGPGLRKRSIRAN
jgi:hypothetical protein